MTTHTLLATITHIFDGIHVGGLGGAGGRPDEGAAIAATVLAAIGADPEPGR